jgi:hypothetical protein
LLAQRNQGNAIFDRIKPFVFKLWLGQIKSFVFGP